MILYFSATGNDKYVAKEISKKTGDELVPLRDLIRWGEYEINVSSGENFGVVMPTYFYGLPSILLDFLEKATINLKGNNYCFFVATYGRTYGNVLSSAKSAFRKLNVYFDSLFIARFVDNWAPVFNLRDEAQNKSDEANGEENTLKIVRSVFHKKKGIDYPDEITTDEFFKGREYYEKIRHTSGFSVDVNKCSSCGLCAKQCPLGVIEMEDGHPVWKKDKCTLCLGCYHRCPEHAIDFMKCSDNGQYTNIKVGLDN